MKWLDKRVREKRWQRRIRRKNWKIGVIMDKLGTLAMDDRAVLKFDVVKTTSKDNRGT